jgi:hypothetical protein
MVRIQARCTLTEWILASQLPDFCCPAGASFSQRSLRKSVDRLLDPLTDIFTPEVASAILELRADSEVEDHITELRRKANDGTLTAAEEAEYKEFVEAVDLISIIQTKARHFLAKHAG